MTTWDVRTDTGALVTNLRTLAQVLGVDRKTAAEHLLADPDVAAGAPRRLMAEVKATARPKPGGGTPPPVSTGSFVSWSGGKGRVDLLVTNGKVPGVDGDDVEGSKKTPAARVVVWEDGKPTRKKIAKSTHTLRRIPPLDKPEKKDPLSALVATVAQHETMCDTLGLPEHHRITGTAVKSVYDRGVGAWPGPDRTTLSAQEWALGRVDHFVKVASGQMQRPGNDVDLLHPDHPLARDVVHFDMQQLKDDLARVMDVL